MMTIRKRVYDQIENDLHRRILLDATRIFESSVLVMVLRQIR